MTTWEVIIVLAVVVGVACPAAILMAAAGGWLISKNKELCPSCGAQALDCVSWMRANPGSWGYYLCESCGARCTRLSNGELTVASDEEWTLYCSDVKPRGR